MTTTRAALHSSLSSEWYTPPEIIAIVREALGGQIQLDPASDPRGQRIVRARAYYDERVNGLNAAWLDDWFCNPPYSTGGGAADWTEKAIAEKRRGIMLLNATTDRKWFLPLWRRTLCFLHKRIRFLETPEQFLARAERADKLEAAKKKLPTMPRIEELLQGPQPTHGNVLVFFGDDPRPFIDVTKPHGQIVTAAHGGIAYAAHQ